MNRSRPTAVVAVAMMTFLGIAQASASPGRAGETHLVSQTSDGQRGNGGSYSPVISPDGRYVAFQSFATNLTGEDYGKPPLLRDGFVQDRATGEIRRIAVPEGGGPPSTHVWIGQFSDDGNYLLFETSAERLVPGDDNSAMDLFMLDLRTWEIERVSLGSDDREGNDMSFGGTLTADNRYLVFSSYATNFSDDVPDGQDLVHVYLRDLELGTTELISRNEDGEPANAGGAAIADITAGGRYVVFQSMATNLDEVDVREDDLMHIFLLDRETGEVTLVNRGLKDPLVADHAFDSRISSDGSLITFTTSAALVPGDLNFQWDVYGYDRTRQRMERISIGNAGQEGSWNASRARPSSDGRYVVFDGQHGLQDGSTTSALMAFVHDRVTGVTEPLAVATDGSLGQRNSTDPAITPDGRLAVFSTASRLLPDQAPGVDVFLRDRGPELGVGSLSATVGDGDIHTSGWATFTGGVLSEAVSDLSAPGRSDTGMDIERVRLVHRADREELFVHLELPSLVRSVNTWGAGFVPANRTGAGLPGTVYGFSFEVDGVRHEARVARTSESHPRAGARLFRCEPLCLEIASIEGSIGAAGNEARLVVPLSVLEAGEGLQLTSMEAFAGPGDLRVGAAPLDSVSLPDAVVPIRRVQFGIAPHGTPVESVGFEAAVAPADGLFSSQMDVAQLAAGRYDLWARACLGAMCDGAVSRPVVVGDDFGSEVIDTILELTLTGRGSRSTLEARLGERLAPDRAVSHRVVDFYSDSQLIGSAPTDAAGIARLAVPPAHRGANRTFEAVFAGDDSYGPSSSSLGPRTGP